MAYGNKGEYDRAIGYYEKDLAIALKSLGPEHPDVGTSYFNLGAAYAQKGDKAKAPPQTFAVLLRASKDMKGDRAKGMEYLLKAKGIFIKRLGPDHPNTKNVQSWIDKIK